MESEEQVRLYGVDIDQKLKFEEHLNTIISEANKKLNALMRVSKFMSQDRLRILLKAFIESLFNYCPLLWMFQSITLNKKLNKLHMRALRVVYKDNSLTFEQMLEKDNSFSIHERNLQKLAIEMYKVKNNLCPKPFRDLFSIKTNGKGFVLPKIRTVNMGEETVRYRGPKTWDMVPDEIKEAETLDIFKHRIKKWKPTGCTCRLCTVFVKGLGRGFMKGNVFVSK